MERDDINNFEEVTLSNVWIKVNILDVIREINKYEIIAESGGLDIIAIGEMESLEIMKVKVDALNQMKAHILILKGNVAQYIDRLKLFITNKILLGIDNHEPLLQNNYDSVSHIDNYFVSDNFQIKLNRLRKIKYILINACGEAGLLMPKKDDEVKIKKIKIEEDT